MVKRARFAFTTVFPFSGRIVTLSSRQLGGLAIETPGFASPPRDGLALDDCSSGGTVAPHVTRYEGSTGSPMTRRYGCLAPFGAVPRGTEANLGTLKAAGSADGLRFEDGSPSVGSDSPALAGLDDEGRACERHQSEKDAHGLSLEDRLHG